MITLRTGQNFFLSCVGRDTQVYLRQTWASDSIPLHSSTCLNLCTWITVVICSVSACFLKVSGTCEALHVLQQFPCEFLVHYGWLTNFLSLRTITLHRKVNSFVSSVDAKLYRTCLNCCTIQGGVGTISTISFFRIGSTLPTVYLCQYCVPRTQILRFLISLSVHEPSIEQCFSCMTNVCDTAKEVTVCDTHLIQNKAS